MRVLAVAQVGNFFEIHEEVRREGSVPSGMREILGDFRVVPGHTVKCFARQVKQDLPAEHAAAFGQCCGNHFVVSRRCDDRHVLKIFCGGSNHRGPTDIDIFYDLLKLHTGLADSLCKRVKVHTHEIDQRDFVCSDLLHMLGIIADGQKPPRNERIQGFHPAVQDFGESRQLRYVAHFNTIGPQQPRCTSGRDDLNFEIG